jgi:hypothetical protein
VGLYKTVFEGMMIPDDMSAHFDLRQSYTFRKNPLLAFHLFLGAPLSEVLRMYRAVKPDESIFLADQSKPTGQAGAFRASEFKPPSDFLDCEAVDHFSMLHDLLSVSTSGFLVL